MKKTTCKNGHNLKKVGTYTRPDGYPACNQCLREADARYRERRRAEKNNPALLMLAGDLRVK